MGKRLKKKNGNKMSAMQKAWKELDEQEAEQFPEKIKVLGRELKLNLSDYGNIMEMPARQVRDLIYFLETLKQENEYLKQVNQELHMDLANARESVIEQAEAFRKYRSDYDEASNYGRMKQQAAARPGVSMNSKGTSGLNPFGSALGGIAGGIGGIGKKSGD